MKFCLPGRGRPTRRGRIAVVAPRRPAPSPRSRTPSYASTALRRDLFLPRADLRVRRRGGGPAGSWRSRRCASRPAAPRLGFETDHRTIPHELGWLGTAVHLDKGCYRGQETVARVHNLGKPPRRLVFLHLDGSEVRAAAATAPRSTRSDGREVGSRRHVAAPATTSSARSRWPWSSGTSRRRARRRRRGGGQEVVVAPRTARRRLPGRLGDGIRIHGHTSTISVNGPSLTSATRMSAPNRPVSTWAPSARSVATTSSTSGSATRPGGRGVPGGPPALARVAVQRELADHQQRRADVRSRALVAQHPQLVDLGRHPLGDAPRRRSVSHRRARTGPGGRCGRRPRRRR